MSGIAGWAGSGVAVACGAVACGAVACGAVVCGAGMAAPAGSAWGRPMPGATAGMVGREETGRPGAGAGSAAVSGGSAAIIMPGAAASSMERAASRLAKPGSAAGAAPRAGGPAGGATSGEEAGATFTRQSLLSRPARRPGCAGGGTRLGRRRSSAKAGPEPRRGPEPPAAAGGGAIRAWMAPEVGRFCRAIRAARHRRSWHTRRFRPDSAPAGLIPAGSALARIVRRGVHRRWPVGPLPAGGFPPCLSLVP